MKYMVEVNAKWLVCVEAESVLSAEHKVLEFDGVWGALAFDNKMLKTDTFAGAVMGCETVSIKELEEMAKAVADAKRAADEAKQAAKEAADRVKELEEMIMLAKDAELKANRAKATAKIGAERR